MKLEDLRLVKLAKKYGWETTQINLYKTPVIRLCNPHNTDNYIETSANLNNDIFHTIKEVDGVYTENATEDFILSCARLFGLPTSFHDVAEVANNNR